MALALFSALAFGRQLAGREGHRGHARDQGLIRGAVGEGDGFGGGHLIPAFANTSRVLTDTQMRRAISALAPSPNA